MPLRTALARALATSVVSPSTPTTLSARRANGNVKLPRPQNKSRTVSVGIHLQQVHCGIHHRDIDVAIDLHEIDRSEFDDDVAAVDFVVERRVVGTQRPHRIQAAALQKDLQAVRGAEICQLLQILRARRLQHAKYQGGRSIASRHLHLRNFLADT